MSDDELSNATRIAALEEQVRKLTEELEQYRMRLAGALIASEGGDGQPTDALEYLRTCPTITSVAKLRAALDRERERCGVLEREVRAARKWERQLWIDLEGVAKPQPPFLTGPMRELTEARKETDTRHALDAAKFEGGGCNG